MPLNERIKDDLKTLLPEFTGPAVLEYPFPRYLSAYLVRHRVQADRGYQDALALNTPHPDFPKAYLVEETPGEPVGNGLIEWERIYATIPPRMEDTEPYSWQRPGVASAGGFGAGQAISSTRLVERFRTRINLDSSHDFEVGNFVTITQPAGFTSGLSFISGFVKTKPVVAVGSTWIEVNGVALASPTGTSLPAVRLSDNARPSRTILVTSRVVKEFYLPGITPRIQSIDDIDVEQRFTITGASGETDSFSEDTFPTLTEYRDMVSGEEWIVPEDSQILHWMGNIWMKQIRYVKMQ